MADTLGLDRDALARLLRAAANLSLVEAMPAGRFALTPDGQYLRSDHEHSLAAECADNDLFQVWTGFMHSLRTGQPAFPEIFGESFFERLSGDRQRSSLFHEHMRRRAVGLYAPLLDIEPFRRAAVCVDVGGGTGALLAQLLRRHPRLTGVLYDLPDVVADSPLCTEPGLSSRCRAVGGNARRWVPEDGDLYVLASVLHDFDDPEALLLLRSCRRSMAPSDTLLLLERVLPPGPQPHPGQLSDLWMLLVVGGRERTLEHWNRLARKAGFRLAHTHSVEDHEVAALEFRPGGEPGRE
ncbi:methyltransferase [Streptomyces sp. NPDC001292]|uniref:methyltransferase n=1 Tax=Streptomyces sp. NPDC001292 TaxID=3364558 RepID=UPI0036B2E2E1